MDQKISVGAYIAPQVTLPSEITIGPNAVILAHVDESLPKTILDEQVEIGANATVLEGVHIGFKARIMPAAVVMRSVPPLAIVQGNPAKIIGYVNTPEQVQDQSYHHHIKQVGLYHSTVRGVNLHTLKCVPDLRGSLSVGEFDRDIPFTAKRYFLVFDVPTVETRGEHAHYECHQFLIAVKGSVSVVADDGHHREEFLLAAPNVGLHLPPMTWGIQYNYSADAVLLVFASHYYESKDYIREYSEFIKQTENICK